MGSDWGTAMGKDRCDRLKRVIGRGVVDDSVGRGISVFAVVPGMEKGGPE